MLYSGYYGATEFGGSFPSAAAFEVSVSDSITISENVSSGGTFVIIVFEAITILENIESFQYLISYIIPSERPRGFLGRYNGLSVGGYQEIYGGLTVGGGI